MESFIFCELMSQTQWRRKRLDQLLIDLSLTPAFLRSDGTTSHLLVLYSLVVGDPVSFHLVVTHDQAKCNSLSSHPLGFCKLTSPYNHSSMSTVLCFLSPLWRLQADRLLTSSAVDRVNLSLNSFPRVSSRSSHLASSPPRIAFSVSPVP